MSSHYVAARRPAGRPSRHLSARRLRRMESRSYRAAWIVAAVFAASAYLLW